MRILPIAFPNYFQLFRIALYKNMAYSKGAKHLRFVSLPRLAFRIFFCFQPSFILGKKGKKDLQKAKNVICKIHTTILFCTGNIIAHFVQQWVRPPRLCINTLRRLKIDSRLKSTNCVLFYGIFHDFSTLAVCRQSNQDRGIRTIGSNYSNFRFFTFVKCFCKTLLTFENV